eukprot:m.10739 g.10739  ORF g.10739 m.10739 type:complete len:391 (+) comp22611_c0_seq2:929-2101(+)
MRKDSLNQTYTLAQDLEPDNLAISADDSVAYVSLQENNAIAVVDLKSYTVSNVYGLGSKDHSQQKNGIDTEENNKIGISVKPKGFYSLYQPDGLGAFTDGGTRYVVSANEGDSKDYVLNGQTMFTEEVNGKYFVGKLTPAANASLWASIQDGGALADLQMSSASVQNQQGLYDSIYGFGGRGFSVFRHDSGGLTQVYESGMTLAQKHAETYPSWFNGHTSAQQRVVDTFDTRSDRKGIETEAVHIANVGGDRILLIGNERTSTIFVYQLSNPASPELLTTTTNLNTVAQTAYDNRRLGDSDPESLLYIPPSSSPVTGKAVMLVGGSYSGTLSVYEFKYNCASGGTGDDCTVPSTPTPTQGSTPTSAAETVYCAQVLVGLLLQIAVFCVLK